MAGFNPDLYKLTCMNKRTISLEGNKYFGGGVLLGMGCAGLMPPAGSVYLRGAPFLLLGTAGIVADWWESSTVCDQETHAQLKEFQDAVQKTKSQSSA